MSSKKKAASINNYEESPTSYADKLGVSYSENVTDSHKKNLGQFFTPLEIAKFMAELVKVDKARIRILDPGCGIGILSCALAEYLVETYRCIVEIEIVAFETDVNILPLAEECFAYLRNWLDSKKIIFNHLLCKNDFILHNSYILSGNAHSSDYYDFVIANPPYFKLPKNDIRVTAAKSIIYGQTNIYSIFLVIAAKLLDDSGRLIFITPRSFCSGSYFRLFREVFFSLIDINLIHLFNSRKDAFKRDNVLQENIIILGRKQSKAYKESTVIPFPDIYEEEIEISTSMGIDDIKMRSSKRYLLKDLLNLSSPQKILHLPVTNTDERVINIFKKWNGSLNAYGLNISTGRVVDFRSTEYIRFKNSKKSVPLLWLHNIDRMNIKWPILKEYKGKPKGQYIINEESSSSLLVDNKNYVLLRRFSTKDDRRRLIAAPYISSGRNKVKKLGIENHLNYIYKIDGELSNIESLGLSALLNSSLFDIYFRTFNGNINVSATELREFPLPDFELIKLLGKEIDRNNLFEISEIDQMVSRIFEVDINFSNN